MLVCETSGSKNKLKVLPVVSNVLQNAELHLFKENTYPSHILCEVIAALVSVLDYLNTGYCKDTFQEQ